jgi:rhomboid protease GluP
VLGFLSPGATALFELGMTGGPAWQLGWWWTLFTATYLHGGLLHILFNMLWVRELVPPVVDVFGPARTFVLFNVAGAVGFLASNLATGAPSIGASGAIFGLLGALVVYGRRRGIAMLTAQAWRWALLLFVFGLIVPSVNNWAHGGGFVGGAVAAACAGVIVAGMALSYVGVMQLKG